MERDDIIRMAREAGFNTDHDLICIEGWEISPYMQRFAALVAAEKDKQIAELQNDFDRVNSQSKTNLLYAARAIEERETARREEREACERLVWDTPEPDDEYVSHREAIAAAIRARGEK